jgi:hypothetical protein
MSQGVSQAQAQLERFHPAVFTLLIAATSGDLRLLLRPRQLKAAFERLGFSVSERQLRNHVRWLVSKGFIRILWLAEGKSVELTPRAEELLKALGLREYAFMDAARVRRP